MRALLLFIVVGCTGANDGAVELSWSFRPASSSDPDTNVDCFLNGGSGLNPVTFVRLDWTSEDGTPGTDFWNCTDYHGVTGFSLEVGDTLLSAAPECGDHVPADPLSYTAPAPVLRNVSAGDTVSLGAVQLVMQVSMCDAQPCICH